MAYRPTSTNMQGLGMHSGMALSHLRPLAATATSHPAPTPAPFHTHAPLEPSSNDALSTSSSATPTRSQVEDLALALVREYLAKKKYKKTLETLATELPVKPTPTTSTALARDLGLSKAHSKNLKSPKPFDTLLELYTQSILTATTTASKNGDEKGTIDRQSSKSRSKSRDKDDTDADLSHSMSKASLSRGSSALSSAASPSPSATRRGVDTSQGAFVSSAFGGVGARPGSATRPGTSPTRSSSSSSSRPSTTESDLMVEEDIDLSEEEEAYNQRAPISTNNRSKHGAIAGSALSSASTFTPTNYPLPAATPVSIETAHALKRLVFGPNHATGTFTDPWLAQGFVFKGDEITRMVRSLAFGLVQHQGGPCGMLAVVQAYIIKELLFTGSAAQLTPAQRLPLLSPSIDVLRRALIRALADILWLVGDERLVRFCIRNPRAARMSGARKMPSHIGGGGTFRPDGISECMQVLELTSLDDVRGAVETHLQSIMAPKGSAVVLFLYSIVLTRGIENVEKDRDDASSSLIGAHSYCTQEMVNLALTGRARSNVFDGNKDFGGMVLRGIDKRSSIGFLSLFEHYENISVGSHLKCPHHPIWVICSESHYTVAFSLDPTLADKHEDGQCRTHGVFDLYYYDELAKQKEEIRLTVDITKKGPAPRDGDLEPPINECIRTKWGKHARIDWNGVEPIL